LGAVLLAGADGETGTEADRLGLLAGGRLAAWDAPDLVIAQEAWPFGVEVPLGKWMEIHLAERGLRVPPGGYSVRALAERLAGSRPA
jgi:hypothetical protein